MNFLIILLLLTSFQQKWYIPYGTRAWNGRVLVGDFNHNGKVDLAFTYTDFQNIEMYILFLEKDSSGFSIVDILKKWVLLWDIGDYDNDGLFDMVTDADSFAGLMIYESPDSFSYPKNEVWRDTIGFPLVIPIGVFDIDKDNIPEIVNGNGNEATDFNIYESSGDNKYSLIFTGYPPFSSASTFAFGDFDKDSANEFVFGNIDGWYAIYECNGNNSYVEILTQQLPTANIFDCFSVNDMDRDGRMEFIVKGFTVPDGKFEVFIFEAVGDNQYQVKREFRFSGGGQGYSASGDVDGDSVPEAVLMTKPWIRILKADGNDNFYVWDSIYVGYNGSIAIYDIDGNGINEIIWSGNDTTRIFEWDGSYVKENPKITSPQSLIPTFVTSPFNLQNYEIYNLLGQRTKRKVKKGIYFIKTKEKSFKIIKIR